jgi:hypothetical protein
MRAAEFPDRNAIAAGRTRTRQVLQCRTPGSVFPPIAARTRERPGDGDLQPLAAVVMPVAASARASLLLAQMPEKRGNWPREAERRWRAGQFSSILLEPGRRRRRPN